MSPAPQPPRMSPEEAKARGRRNIAIALGLLLFALILFVVTLVRMQGQSLDAGAF
jgi:hypothetical protein